MVKKQAPWLKSEYWLIPSIIGIRSSKQRTCALCLNDIGSRQIGPWEIGPVKMCGPIFHFLMQKIGAQKNWVEN